MSTATLTRPAPAAIPAGYALPEWLDHQAARYRSWGTPLAAWFAAKVAEMAATARSLQAGTPADYDDRLEVMEVIRDERIAAAAKGGAL